MTSIGPALASASYRLLSLPNSKRQLDPDGSLTLWHWIEDNSVVVFPLIGVLIAALVFFAVRRSSVNSEAQLAQRRSQKDAITRLMRARLSLTADQTASELSVDRYHAAALLDELVQEGALVQGTLPGGVFSYRLKGF